MNVKINVLPESTLAPQQIVHLRIARFVAGEVTVYPADLHDSVKIIGAYRLYGGPIYVAPERLHQLRNTINTVCHELGHHVSQADDGTRAHSKAIRQVTDKLVGKVNKGELDGYLSEAVW